MEHKLPVIVKLTILGYELNSKQNVYFNYLLPAIFECLLFIFHCAVDVVLVYRHYMEEDSIWGGLTLFFMYIPVIGCFIMTVSSWEMWPEFEGCGGKNISWFFKKVLQHIFFPISSLWRFAEKIFWSIEALVLSDEEKREEALNNSTAPRSIEFFFFLRGFLHTIPQILLQLHILMRNFYRMDKETIDTQAASILINIAVMAVTTVLYQRFKTQQVGGRDYPWLKPPRRGVDCVDSNLPKRRVGIIYCNRDNVERIRTEIDIQEHYNLYDANSDTSSYLTPVGEPEDSISEKIGDEVDFPKAVRFVTALPEDDLVGKILSFMWWYCFLIARFLAISAFAYFFPKDIIWLLSSHFILCVAFLLYDAQAYVVRRTKAVFFIFIGLIYIFCIIEFKKRFKKSKFIYVGYFVLTFSENFIMCLIWWCSELESIYNDWWFKFIFYVFIGSTFLSFSSMIFYNIISKPSKVNVGREII